MRKLISIFLAIAVMLWFGSTANAANSAYATIIPNLSFSGTTATCDLTVYAGYTTDSIEASVVLKNGTIPIKQWTNLTANGYMDFSDTAYVSHGSTYTMQVTLKINGVSYSVADITKICP
ncbi:MAG: hypothetical protein IKH28_08040 [Lachnospiraceae bacterium]|nr:hypothetical protein [Lachnospiraceae bacterium]